MSGWQEFSGFNRGYVLELYEKYRQDPSSVDDDTKAIFERWAPSEEESPAALTTGVALEKVVGAVNLAESIRRYGHLAAKLDPMGMRPPIGDPSLLAATHGVTDEDLRQMPASLIAGPLDGVTTAYDAVEALRRIYCSTTGYDYAHVFVPEEREWLRQAAERGRFRAPADPIDFEHTVERTLLEWRKRFVLRQVLFDPFQMASTAQRLAKAGMPIEEYPQTVPNLTAATSNLFDLIQSRSIALYSDAAMRLAVSRAIIVESSRGWRLDKLKQQHKIDVVVALSMACLAAVRGQGKPGYDLFAPGLFD